MTPLPPDDRPVRPARAHRTIAVSLIELPQQPLLVACEWNRSFFASVICSADELPSDIRASAVS